MYIWECTRSNVKESKIQKFPGGIPPDLPRCHVLTQQIFILLPSLLLWNLILPPLSHFLDEGLITSSRAIQKLMLTVKCYILLKIHRGPKWYYVHWLLILYMCLCLSGENMLCYISNSLLTSFPKFTVTLTFFVVTWGYRTFPRKSGLRTKHFPKCFPFFENAILCSSLWRS